MAYFQYRRVARRRSTNGAASRRTITRRGQAAADARMGRSKPSAGSRTATRGVSPRRQTVRSGGARRGTTRTRRGGGY